MTRRLYADVHILQTVPPSNLNRDDSGSPKQALYGGVRRARVSSQAWKRATRIAFTERVPQAELATRTKMISTLLATRLTERLGITSEQAVRLATALLAPLGIKPAQKKAEQTAYLLFFGRPQLDAIIDLVADRAQDLLALSDKDLATELATLPVSAQLATGHPIDVALFGRMVADVNGLNVDAAAQVAHALSTHATEIEFDYYTAVDDENTTDSGAGMIGNVEFNSATLYRYATLGVHQLRENLTDPAATAQAVELFLDAFTRSMPTGHATTFAHRTLPHAVLVALRTDQPINLVTAFEQPVTPLHGGIADESLRRLATELATVTTTWGVPAALTAATYTTDAAAPADVTAAFGPSMPFPQLRDRVHAAVTSWLNGDDPQ